MVTKIVTFVAIVVQVVNSQRLLAPINYPQVLNELFERRSQPIPSLSIAESDTLCKTFASSIQNVILEKFAQNCLRKPVFSQIAGPLVNEIASNVCKCPVCSAVNISPNSYTKTFITPAAVSNLINNANINNVPNNCVNNVPFNNVPVNNVPVNFVIPNNVNLNNVVKPANNVQLSDLFALLKGLNECSCRGPVVG